MAERRAAGWARVALVPPLLWVAVLVLLPNLLLVTYSLRSVEDGQVTWTLGLGSYADLVTSDTTMTLLARTLVTAVAAAALATVIAYPVALLIVRRVVRRRLLAVLLVVVPLWVSYLVRVYSWKFLLGDNGVVNSAAQAVGLVEEPLSFLLYSRFAVLLTLTYVSIPFVFVAAYSALERVPASLLDAASDAGATPWRVFTTVIWPLSRQGAAVGFGLALLICVGDYLTPAMVGGLEGTMVGTVIVTDFGIANNWPRGAALSVLLLAAVGAVLAVLARLTRVEGILDHAS